MRPKAGTVGVAAVFLLAAGFALGRWTGQEAVPPVVTAPVPAPVRPEAASPEAVPGKPGAERAAARADPEALLRAWLASLPEPAIPKGEGVITARVVVQGGDPLPGVEITLRMAPKLSDYWTGPAPGGADEPAAVRLARNAAFFRWTEASARKGVTDAAGECRFDGLADATHGLTGSCEAHIVQPRGNAYSVRPGATVLFDAVPAADVRVEILRPDGMPPPSATIEWKYRYGPSQGGFSPRPWSPEKPIVSLPPGKGTLSVRWEDLVSEPQEAELAAGQPPPTFQFALRAKVLLRGRIVFPEGEAPSRYVILNLVRLPPSGTLPPEKLHTGGQTSVAPPKGFGFAYGDVEPGRYMLSVRRTQNGPVAASEEIAFPGDGSEREIRVPPLLRSQYAIIRALGPGGEVLRDTEVSMHYSVSMEQGIGLGGNFQGNFIPREDGTVWALLEGVPNPPPGKMARLEVEVRSAAQGTRQAVVPDDASPEVVLRFEEAGAVDLRVSGYEGSRYVGRVGLWLQPADWRSGLATVWTVDRQGPEPSGRVPLPAVQPGEYVAVLSVRVGDRTQPFARVPISVRPGPNTITVPLPELYTLTVRGISKSAGAARTDDGNFQVYAFADAEGKAVLDGLPPGEYHVYTEGKSQTVTVPSTREVQF